LITAPIRLPSKTAASLEDKIQTLLGRGDRPLEIRRHDSRESCADSVLEKRI
jgi:hypothetical protein